MQSIMTHDSPSAPAFSPQERIEKLQALDAYQMTFALTFLSGYAPAVFDAVLDVTGPERPGGYSDGDDPGDAYCIRCGQPAGIFPRLGLEWRHCRGQGLDQVEVVEADHVPLVRWRGHDTTGGGTSGAR